MIHKEVPYRVLLPNWCKEKARTKDEFKANIAKYMRDSYPNYIVFKVEDGYALCRRK